MTDMLTPSDWQLEDLTRLRELDCSANWSQMGCYKTSTALWLLDSKLGHLPNPAVLVVTTASGKGAYFRDIPKTIGDKWQIINYKADGFYLILNGMQVKIGKAAGLAETIEFPHIIGVAAPRVESVKTRLYEMGEAVRQWVEHGRAQRAAIGQFLPVSHS